MLLKDFLLIVLLILATAVAIFLTVKVAKAIHGMDEKDASLDRVGAQVRDMADRAEASEQRMNQVTAGIAKAGAKLREYGLTPRELIGIGFATVTVAGGIRRMAGRHRRNA